MRTAVSIEPDSGITDEERAFIRKLSLNDSNKKRLLEGQAHFFKVKLDREVRLPMGSAVCSAGRVGNGFVVKGCDFGYNRSRGILIKASHGEVSGNKITHGWMAAVLIAPEFWWFEAASSSDLVIKNNVIEGCRRPAIEVLALGGNGKPLPSGAHRDIRIAGNHILESAWPNIRVTSTSSLAIEDNQLTSAEPGPFVPPVAHPWNWGTAKPQPVLTEQCNESTAKLRRRERRRSFMKSMHVIMWALAVRLALAGGLISLPAATAADPNKDLTSPDPVYDIDPAEAARNQYYDQPERPQFHYTPIQGHIGDATGLIFYQGEFHLFYMSDKWERRRNRHKCWGHAISRDLLHWQEMPSVLDPVIDHKPAAAAA